MTACVIWWNVSIFFCSPSQKRGKKRRPIEEEEEEEDDFEMASDAGDADREDEVGDSCEYELRGAFQKHLWALKSKSS